MDKRHRSGWPTRRFGAARRKGLTQAEQVAPYGVRVAHALSAPGRARPEDLRTLQRDAGNQAVAALFRPGSGRVGVQTWSLERGPVPKGERLFFGVELAVDAPAIRAQLDEIVRRDGFAAGEYIARMAGIHRSMAKNRRQPAVELDVLLTQFAALRDERTERLDAFHRAGMRLLIDICTRSEKVLEEEQARYGLTTGNHEVPGNDDTQALVAAVRELVAKRDALRVLEEEATVESEGSGMDAVDTMFEPPDETDAEGAGDGAGSVGGPGHAPARAGDAQAVFAALLDGAVQQYPILRGFLDPDRGADLEALGQPEFRSKYVSGQLYSDQLTSSLGDEARGNLDKIRGLRAKAESGRVTVWQLPTLVDLTKTTLAVTEPAGREIDEHLKQVQHDEAVKTLLWSVFALALSIVGALPTGGMSLAAGAGVMAAKIGGVAVGVGLLAGDNQQFELESAASKVGLADEPSLVWLLVDAGFTIGDIAGLRAVASLVKPGLAALRSRRALRTALAALAPGDAQSVAVLRRAINEVGVAQTATLSGKSVDDLIRVAGDDGELVARIRGAASGPVTMDELGSVLGQLRTATPVQLTELGQQVAKAIDLHGALPVLRAAGGWKQIVSVLGKDSPASARLLVWRDDVVGGAINDFAATLPKGEDGVAVVRTGSVGEATNDFDWSTLGPHSAENRDALYHFLEARFGLSRPDVKKALDGEFFTDPRRLHLYDELEPGLREEMARIQLEFSEKLVYNRMLHEARERGATVEFQQKLISEMETRGIDNSGYIELSKGDVAALNQQIDAWHTALGKARNADEKRTLARRIAEAQGQINAIERSGYLTGGGASEFAGLNIGAKPPATKTMMYEAALEQMLKFHDSLDEFDELTRMVLDAATTGELAEAIKKLAKYGDRFNQMADELLVAPASADIAATLRRLAFALDSGWDSRTMKEMLVEARSGAVLARLGSNPAGMIAQARWAVDDLLNLHDDLIARMRAEAGIIDVAVDPRPLVAIQRATLIQVRLARVSDLLRQSLGNLQSALAAGYAYAGAESDSAPAPVRNSAAAPE